MSSPGFEYFSDMPDFFHIFSTYSKCLSIIVEHQNYGTSWMSGPRSKKYGFIVDFY